MAGYNWNNFLHRRNLEETRWYDHILIYTFFVIGGAVGYILFMFFIATRTHRRGTYTFDQERYEYLTSPLVLYGGAVAIGIACVVGLIIHQIHDHKVEAEKQRVRALRQQRRDAQKNNLFSHLDNQK